MSGSRASSGAKLGAKHKSMTALKAFEFLGQSLFAAGVVGSLGYLLGFQIGTPAFARGFPRSFYVGLVLSTGYVLVGESRWRKPEAADTTATTEDRGTLRLVLGVIVANTYGGPVLAALTYPFGSLAPAATAAGVPDQLAVVALSAVALSGFALRWYAMSTLGSAFTRTLRVLDGHRVRASGPYAFCRHPGYMANILVWVSTSAMICQSWLALGLVLLGAAFAYSKRIAAEEAMLLSSDDTSESYARYCSQVRSRLVPFVF
eukprot:Amastigsp_a847237_16.p2 type:complete len:261 gc:universal Amastigsp_a847237_16:32-814(+)